MYHVLCRLSDGPWIRTFLLTRTREINGVLEALCPPPMNNDVVFWVSTRWEVDAIFKGDAVVNESGNETGEVASHFYGERWGLVFLSPLPARYRIEDVQRGGTLDVIYITDVDPSRGNHLLKEQGVASLVVS